MSKLVAGTALTATGTEQTLTCPRGKKLVVRCLTAEVSLGDVSGGATFPWPANTPFVLGPADSEQVIYVTATAGATIYWMTT